LNDSFETILVRHEGSVAVIQLNRPEALNAFNAQLMNELGDAVHDAEHDDTIKVVIITGSQKAFAAGADIKEMMVKDFSQVYNEDFITRSWQEVTKIRKPVIAAVAGFALGGGCELAMMCDMIIAADNAKFGQPEIKIGTMPGAGGSQRMAKAIGKAKTMDMVLTGRMMDAEEAERAGLVARIVPADQLMDVAMEAAQTMASYSLPTLMMAKEAVNMSQDTGLTQGVLFERRLFHSSFGLDDRREGMTAFAEKRKPEFKDR
jgi:Enoyl-CoA hydratase/carnithine racemase